MEQNLSEQERKHRLAIGIILEIAAGTLVWQGRFYTGLLVATAGTWFRVQLPHLLLWHQESSQNAQKKIDLIITVIKEEFDGEETSKCEECGFHFREREVAERCEKFCREKGVCNSEITRKALERRG